MNREKYEESERSNQPRDTIVPKIQEEYITQLSEVTEERVTKKLSQELSRTEGRIPVTLSKLDEFLLNPQFWLRSRFVPETSWSS